MPDQKGDGDYAHHFSISNIPWGVASKLEEPEPRIVTRIYDDVVFVTDLLVEGCLSDISQATHKALKQSTLNSFAALPRTEQQLVRTRLQHILKSSDDAQIATLAKCKRHVSEVQMHLPVTVGDFSDFSCSQHHVLNAGEAVMGSRTLPPAFLHYPIGYGGRSSSIVTSGTPIKRPLGQYRQGSSGVTFGPSQAVDFELEIACVIGKPSKFQEGVDIADADDHIFGLVLLNDWSARDIQGLEMNPLGPFSGKSFGTTISPWIVTLDALTPFECESAIHGQKYHDSSPSYINDKKPKSQYDITLCAEIINTADLSRPTTLVSESHVNWLHWTFRDMVVQQTVNGCSVRSGDLLATGTVSGSEEGSHGCLLEITKGGKRKLKLVDGEEITYLKDGHAVRISGWAGHGGEGGAGVGFGECFGVLGKARDV